MEQTTEAQEEAVNQIYAYAARLMVQERKSADEAVKELVAQGLDEESAVIVVNNLEQHIAQAKKSRAKKDMLYGALWCVGGVVATASHIGFIFWGAMLFGGIQFFRGLINAAG